LFDQDPPYTAIDAVCNNARLAGTAAWKRAARANFALFF